MELITLFVTGIASVWLGALVLSSQRKDAAAHYFFGVAASIGVWGMGIAVFRASNDTATMLMAAQVYYIAAAAIAISTLLMAMTLSRRIASPILDVFIALPFLTLATAITIYPQFLIQGVQVAGSSPNIAQLNLQGYTIYTVFFVVYYGAAMSVFAYRILHEQRKLVRTQMKYVLNAFCWAGAVGAWFNLVLPWLGNYYDIWMGPLAVFVFIPIIYFTIARHGLFDLRSAVVRTATYILSIATLAFLYFGLAYGASETLLSDTGTNVSVSPINIILALALALIFQPIKNFFDKITHDIFYIGHYRPEEFIAELGEILTSTTDLRSLIMHVSAKIDQTFKASWTSFVVLRREHGLTQVGTGPYATIDHDMVLQMYSLSGRKSAVIRIQEHLNDQNEAHRRTAVALHKKGVELVLPLLRTESHVGYVLIGERLASGYTRQDFKTLEMVSNELVIAIQNSLSVQEVKDLNASLQERISQAIDRLQKTNERLRKLDETKDEFISMASHQLRTPLTSIKGYLSMVLDGDTGEVTPQQRAFLDAAYTSSERMVRLIADFLNVSRLQTGKFVVERQPADLRQLIIDEVTSMQRLADSRGIKLVLQAADDMPLLMIDEDKVRQVVMNFIDNAIYYSHDNAKVLVKLYIHYNWVVFEVHDRGIGVPKKVQDQLFTKFFRAENARNQRPDGTGVGLYLAKRVITALEGELVFESEEGRGSMFGFRLSLKRLKVADWHGQ